MVDRLIGQHSAASGSGCDPAVASWARSRSCWWASRRMVRARSSSDQEPAGQPALAGSSWVASSRTCRRCEGGKDRRTAGAGAVEQALKAVRGEAATPGADGVVVAAQLAGDLQVGGPVLVAGTQDDTG